MALEVRGTDMHIMLDLETMGTKSNAAIVSIGAVSFDKDRVFDEFYIPICLQDSVSCGLSMDAGTVLWWLDQPKEAIRAFHNSEVKGLDEALYSFADWTALQGDPQTIFMWGNGPDFDNAILWNAYRIRGITAPWEWNKNRCFRTVKALVPSAKMERSGVVHNALDDARNQAHHLIYCTKRLGGFL